MSTLEKNVLMPMKAQFLNTSICVFNESKRTKMNPPGPECDINQTVFDCYASLLICDKLVNDDDFIAGVAEQSPQIGEMVTRMADVVKKGKMTSSSIKGSLKIYEKASPYATSHIKNIFDAVMGGDDEFAIQMAVSILGGMPSSEDDMSPCTWQEYMEKIPTDTGAKFSPIQVGKSMASSKEFMTAIGKKSTRNSIEAVVDELHEFSKEDVMSAIRSSGESNGLLEVEGSIRRFSKEVVEISMVDLLSFYEDKWENTEVTQDEEETEPEGWD